MNGRGLLLLGVVLSLAGVAAVGASYVVPADAASPSRGTTVNMMGGAGMMGGTWSAPRSGLGPDEAGFVAGTSAAPRVVRLYALPNDRFSPDTVIVKAGETITFEVTTMGPTSHEFTVGPAAEVAADKAGTPEVADIGMMQTKSLTYSFGGSGSFAFACHEPGHYEAGMRGAIVVR